MLIPYLYEKLNPTPYIKGIWYCGTCTEKSETDNYKNMTLLYEIRYSEGGNGTYEKIYEDSATKKKCNLTTNSGKTFGDVSISHLENSIFTTDELGLKLNRSGEDPVTRNFTMRYNKRENIMIGSFKSTISGQSGTVVCQQEQFNSPQLCTESPKYADDATKCSS